MRFLEGRAASGFAARPLTLNPNPYDPSDFHALWLLWVMLAQVLANLNLRACKIYKHFLLFLYLDHYDGSESVCFTFK